MAKLFFRYGTMNCGKTRQLLSVWYNYKEKGMTAIIGKPDVDTKGANTVISRNNDKQEVDLLINGNDDLFGIIKNMENKPNCILIDEAQFLSNKNVDDLSDVVDYLNIPVICYGLLKDFTGHLFIGSKRLIETANSFEEIKTICNCGKKATEVIRYVNSVAVEDGDQVVIDGSNNNVVYDSSCRICKKRILRKER